MVRKSDPDDAVKALIVGSEGCVDIFGLTVEVWADKLRPDLYQLMGILVAGPLGKNRHGVFARETERGETGIQDHRDARLLPGLHSHLQWQAG